MSQDAYADALRRINLRQQKRNQYTNITPAQVKREIARAAKHQPR